MIGEMVQWALVLSIVSFAISALNCFIMVVYIVSTSSHRR